MQIAIQQLTKVYPGNRGLLPTDVCIGAGDMMAIVGHNGAGKSTLLKMMAGWIVPDSGRMVLDGLPMPSRRILSRKIGFVPEIPNLHDAFSVEYNLALFGRLFGAHANRIHELMEEFHVVSFKRSLVRVLSRGMKQRVSIVRALIADPSILLLDEPTVSLDFETAAEIHRLMRRLHDGGKTLVFTSHRHGEICELATRVLVLQNGVVQFDGSPHAYGALPLQNATRV